MALRQISSFHFQLGLQHSALASNDLLTANPSLLSPHFPTLSGTAHQYLLLKPFISEVANWQPGDPATDMFLSGSQKSWAFPFLFD